MVHSVIRVQKTVPRLGQRYNRMVQRNVTKRGMHKQDTDSLTANEFLYRFDQISALMRRVASIVHVERRCSRQYAKSSRKSCMLEYKTQLAVGIREQANF